MVRVPREMERGAGRGRTLSFPPGAPLPSAVPSPTSPNGAGRIEYESRGKDEAAHFPRCFKRCFGNAASSVARVILT